MSVRRVVIAIAVIFVIYAILNDPTKSANVTGNAWDHIKDAINNLGDFFDALIAR